jgi:hydroxyacylglutathione hydrolase
MLFRTIYDDNLAHAAYLIGCQRTGEAILIDPARDVDRYVRLAEQKGFSIRAIAETHIHADFLSGARELAERTGARLYLSDEGDAEWKYGWLDARKGGGSYDHQLLHDGDRFEVGLIEFRVLHSPGHTPEHVSFVVTDRGGGANEPMGMLTGDFVFVGDMGRPDLLETAAGYEGVAASSAKSLGRSALRFLEMQDFLQVWPAHGAGSACGKALGAVPQSTIGYERRFNPALLLVTDENKFTEFILDGQPEPPLYFGRMKVQNRDGVPLLGELPLPPRLDAGDSAGLEGKVVVDVRPWPEFRAGHLARSLHASLTAAFHTVVGSYVAPEQEIVLVTPEDKLELAVRELVRIGLDRVAGWVSPNDLVQAGAALAEAAEVTVSDLRDRLTRGEDLAVLDVRRSAELGSGVIEGAANAAHTRLPRHTADLPRDRPIYVYCAMGGRSAYAVAYLKHLGLDAVNVAGGMSAWRREEFPLSAAEG